MFILKREAGGPAYFRNSILTSKSTLEMRFFAGRAAVLFLRSAYETDPSSILLCIRLMVNLAEAGKGNSVNRFAPGREQLRYGLPL